MRSSIACVRCRRSKVKCVNSGVGTACRSCEAGGRECTYPVPVSSVRRRESIAGQPARPEGLVDDPVRKPRQQRKSNVGLPGQPIPVFSEPSGIPLDALDASLLTPSVWQELFDIFQLHFSTDLPFIHPPTFLKPLRQATTMGLQHSQGPPVQPPASTEFLLAFLALTARFHPKLVAHHSPATSNRPSSPLVASEFYASAASARIKTVTGERLGIYDIESTQALLMLALHDWGMNRGAQAWAYLGIAIRSAQVMGLQYEKDLDDLPLARSMPMVSEGRSSFSGGSPSDAFVKAEIRRRTFWTCFIFDRYMSNGKYRPHTLNRRDVRIQLPASEQAFLFGEQVRTLMLSEEQRESAPLRADSHSQRRPSLNGGMKRHTYSIGSLNGKSEDEQSKWEIGAEEGLMSRYIRILDIYSRIAKWACGGRYVCPDNWNHHIADKHRRDNLPWQPQSQWFSLRQALEDFRAALPRQHLLNPQNTSAHIHINTSTPYTLVHITVSLCQILLYREFIPFIPFRHGKPQGPLDGASRHSSTLAPQGFWESSGQECFGAARNIIDLLRTCQEWGVAVETPIVGFAIYNVSLLGVYLINFPWMDTQGYLRRAKSTREDHVPHGADAARKALEMMGPRRTRLHMAEGWLKTLKRAHKYFSRLRTAWFDSAPRMMQGQEREVWNDQSIATAQLHPPDAESTRVILERVLRELDGGDDDSDADMADFPQLDGISGPDMASPHVKQETPLHNTSDQHAQQEERWNAINSVAAAASALSSAASMQPTTATSGSPGQQQNSAHFRFFSSYGAPSASPPTPSSYSHPSFRPAYPDSSSPNGAHQLPKSPHVQTPMAPSWAVTNGGSGSREPLHGINAYASTSNVSTRRESEAATSGAPSFATPVQTYSAPAQQGRASDRDIRDPEAWLSGLEKIFGPDDLAAFVDGAEIGEVARGLARQGRGGWLSAVWGIA